MITASVLSLFMVNPIVTYLNDALPVKTDWRVLDSRIDDGKDLVVSGTMIKHFDCDYQPPPGALDIVTGEHMLVESLSPTKLQSWPASDKPYKWGPWKIYNGAGRLLKFYNRDKCSFLWTSYTELGVFNALTMEQVQ